MNKKLEDFLRFIKGKKAAVIGVGISNRPLICWLKKIGVEVMAFDRLSEDDPSIVKTKADFKELGIEIKWSLGEGYLEPLKTETFDIVFKTPKMRFETEELMTAKSGGAILTSEMELFMDLCPARIYAVTGSDGKTTTTTLVSEILKKGGYKVYLGGNIGTPLLDRIEEITETDKVVLELSSFQLLGMKRSADVAIVTNITPNHLDFHKDYDEYINAKKNVFLSQGPCGRVILNSGCELTYNMKDEARGKVAFFSRDMENIKGKIPAGFTSAYIGPDGILTVESEGKVIPVIDEKDIFIPGKHNAENFLAAILATIDDVSVEDIVHVAKNFPGVPHRIEFIREINGARWYNSSIDTSPNRTMNTMLALKARGEKGILICGGADKKCDYTGLGDAILDVCDRIIIYGSNYPFVKDIIEKEAKGRPYQLFRIDDDPEDVYEFPEKRQNVIDAFENIISKAIELSKPGEIVIMSSIGTSYDHFRHFEHRGDMFKELVNNIKA